MEMMCGSIHSLPLTTGNPMPLNRVTITGADDSTDLQELAEISDDFPFVEWGILVGSRTKKVASPEYAIPRMPSVEWIHELVKLREQTGNRIALSLHVCGRLLKEIASGKSSLAELIGPQLFAFSRVQLNWHSGKQKPETAENILAAFCDLDCVGMGWDPQIIFQLDGVNDDIWIPASRRFGCAGLFDRSHGNGVLPGEWPKCRDDLFCGWAGGLGPDNLAEEIPKITAQSFITMDFWIDMETKVRSDDDTELDMNRVGRCLSISSSFIGKS